MTHPLARVELVWAGQGEVHARLAGEIDLSNADSVERQLNDAAREAARMVLDLTGIEYMDSQGVRILQHLTQRHVQGGLDLTIVVTPESIAGDLLVLTRVAEGVDVVEPPPNAGA